MANSYTPGLKLRKPGLGEDFWDDDVNGNFDVIEAALGRGGEISGVIGGGLVVSNGGGLTAHCTSGSCRVAGSLKTIPAGDLPLADGSLNFVYVDAFGSVQVSTTLSSAAYCALALVETAAGAVVRVGDMRRRIFDGLHEHNEDGSHRGIQPPSITPSAITGAAYGRSTGVSAHEDPEAKVNNLIIKPDARSLINTLLPMNSPTFTEYTAHNLGSGYVPAKANAIWMSVSAAAVGGVASASLKFWPSDQDHAGADYLSASRMRVPENAGSGGLWQQLMVRLSPDGKFKLNWGTADPNGFWLTAVLLGWVEAA